MGTFEREGVLTCESERVGTYEMEKVGTMKGNIKIHLTAGL